MESENTINQFLNDVGNLQNNAITVTKKLLEGGKEEVTLNLQRKPIIPERMESPARAHTFHDADGFIKYLQANKPTDGVMMVLADVTAKRIIAVLNDKAAKGFENITLQPPYHPEFILLSNLVNKTLEITDFAKMVLRNRSVTHASKIGDTTAARDIALLFSQITVSKKVTACTGAGNKSTNGVMVETSISAGANTQQPIALPEAIKFKVPIYLNTEEVIFDITIKLAHDEVDVYIVTDAPELELRKFEVFEKILEPIKAMEGVLVSYGTPATENWNYNTGRA
jgi:hypothetical protein